jgi:hypothetical protein
MRKVLILAIALAFLGFILYLFVSNPGLFKQIYLWLIGLFSVIAWPIKRVWDWLTSSKEIKEIELSNAHLKQDLAQIKKELAAAQQKLEEERQKNKIRIEELETRIKLEDQVGSSLKKELESLKAQSPEKLIRSVSLRRQLQKRPADKPKFHGSLRQHGGI